MVATNPFYMNKTKGVIRFDIYNRMHLLLSKKNVPLIYMHNNTFVENKLYPMKSYRNTMHI